MLANQHAFNNSCCRGQRAFEARGDSKQVVVHPELGNHISEVLATLEKAIPEPKWEISKAYSDYIYGTANTLWQPETS